MEHQYRQHSFDNDQGHDPDFDLDEYIREKSQEDSQPSSNANFRNKKTSRIKDGLLFFAVFIAAILWVNDWSVSQAWNRIFGENETTSAEVSGSAPSFTIPDIPSIPEVPPVPDVNVNGSFVEYLAQIKNNDLQNHYSNSGWQALYQSEVSIDYLTELNEEGYLEAFSYSAIIGLYHGGVNLDYLNDLREMGYLDRFSYSAIIGLYNGGVEVEYLDELNTHNHLDEFSYSAIIALYNSDVTVDYLNQLRDNGLLEDMSYTDIIRSYNMDH